jgi:hypothetical protein
LDVRPTKVDFATLTFASSCGKHVDRVQTNYFFLSSHVYGTKDANNATEKIDNITLIREHEIKSPFSDALSS